MSLRYGATNVVETQHLFEPLSMAVIFSVNGLENSLIQKAKKIIQFSVASLLSRKIVTEVVIITYKGIDFKMRRTTIVNLI